MELDYVLLGLIHLSPDSSGYQLKNTIDRSTGFFFNAHLSQIYPALKRMTNKGWLSYQVIPKSGRLDEKRYRIMPEGKRELDAWLIKPFEFKKSRTSMNNYFLKLILMGHLEPTQIVSYIDAGLAYATAEQERLRASNLGYELSLLEGVGSPAKQQYQDIWQSEFAVILNEFEARIVQLRKLREKLTSR